MKDRLLKKRSPLLLCMLAGLCCLFLSCLILSCRGNGGSSYSDGAVYTPGGGASGGSGSIGGSVVTAEDLWKLSNAGSIDRIVELFQTGFTSGSCIVVIPAADLGLPAGGTVTLTITGPGINYTADATAGADGNVTFEVPLLETKTTVTVSLTVQDANGTALYIGSEEQEVGDDGNLHVGLVRQFWTLPASLTVTASPDGLIYNRDTLTTASTTFSISGLEGAPAAAVFSYEWEDADDPGTLAGTGAMLTKTLGELLGGTVPAGDVTKSFSVTVSYTDAGGTTATASGSASVVIGGPVTLPEFSVDFTAPTSINGAQSSATAWALTSMADAFSLTASPDSGEPDFPAGTTFEWKVNGSLVSQTGATCTLRPSDLFSGTSTTTGTPASPYAMNVTCTAKNSRAAADKPGTGGSRQLFYIFDLPDFVISIGKPAGATGTASPYGLADLTSSFTLTATGATFPAGTSFEWEVNGTPLSATGASASFSPGTDLSMTESSIGRTSAAPTSFSISCTAKNPHAADLPKSASVSAYLAYPMPSSFTISISPPASATVDANGAYALANLTGSFTITASGTFPPGTTFLWTLGSTHLEEDGTYTYSLTPAQLGITAANPGSAASPITSQILGCRAKNEDAIPTFRIGDNNPKIKAYYAPPLDAPTGISIADVQDGTSSGGAWTVDTTGSYGGTSTTPIENRMISLSVSTGSYPVPVNYVWSFTDGTEQTTMMPSVSKLGNELGVTLNSMTGQATFSISCRVIPADPSSGYVQSDPKSQGFAIIYIHNP